MSSSSQNINTIIVPPASHNVDSSDSGVNCHTLENGVGGTLTSSSNNITTLNNNNNISHLNNNNNDISIIEGNTSENDVTQYSDRNLIINYVPSNFSDDDLTNLFQSVGPIKNCRIIRDKVTHQTYGFGFCEFIEARHAVEAIERFNGYNIANKQLKVAFARLPGQESKNCNLFVQNIPCTVSREEIRAVFGKYGRIVECRRINDKDGNSRRISFVLFESRSCAEAAKNELNNNSWPYDELVMQSANGNLDMTQILVQFAAENSKKLKPMRPATGGQSFNLPNRFSGAAPHTLPGSNIPFINNYLNNNVIAAATSPQAQANQSNIYEIAMSQFLNRMRSMSTAGTYANGYMPHCMSNGPSIMSTIHQSMANSNMYGTNNSHLSPPHSSNTVNTGNNHFATPYGQPLTSSHPPMNNVNQQQFLLKHNLNHAGPGPNFANVTPPGGSFVLYVYNTGNEMTEEKMRELFQGFGHILKIDIPRESALNTNTASSSNNIMGASRSKNFGFVTLGDYNSAIASISRLNGMLYFGKKLQVSFRKEKAALISGNNGTNYGGGGGNGMQKCLNNNNN